VITAPLVVLGQILGFAFATGLNLYATLALIGLASRFGWIAGLPPAVQGIANGFVWITAAALYFIEFFVDKITYADTVWDVIHTLVRPIAATVLVAMALAEASLPVQIGGALLAGATALGAHGLKAGLRLIINIHPRKALTAVVSIVEDIFAVAIAIIVLMYPVAALGVSAAALPVAIVFGPRLWRVAVLALRAMIARVRGFFRRRDWLDSEDLPRKLRVLIPPAAPGRAEARVARAALRGLKGVGSYRNGFVVVTDAQPVFMYRTLMRPRSLALPELKAATVHRGIWTDAVEFKTEGGKCTLFLLKDGPRADAVLAELHRISAGLST
jgi:hypothetical protein